MHIKWLTICIFLVLTLSLAHPAVHAQLPVGDVEVRFEDLGYGNITLNGLYGMASVWVPLQNRWVIDSPLTLEVTYTGSPLLNSRAAILTVKANGQAVTSIRPVGDGRPRSFRVSIPPELAQQPGFTLEFSGFLKLTDLECEDTNNPGQWLIIQNNTRISLSPSITDEAPGMENLLDALVMRTYDDNPTPIIMAVPNVEDPAVLTAAARIAAYLGTATGAAHLPFTVKSFDDLTARDRRIAHLIMIGTVDTIPYWDNWADTGVITPVDDAFTTPGGRILPPESALIQLFTSPWNPRNNILLLSAAGMEGIELGGTAFAHRQTRQTFDGPYVVVDELVTLPAPVVGLPWSSEHTTFRQLGEVNRRVTGIGNQDVFYYFRLPPGWVFAPDTQLTLHMAFSPALRGDESYAIVYINDVYIGAVNVDADDGDVWVAMDLPTRALNELGRGGRPMNLDLRLAIANLLPVDSCDQINVESSWTMIYNDSYFTIDHTYAELPDLHALPYPFVTARPTAPISIVLPQDPTATDLQNALSTAAILGRHTLPDITIEVIGADAVDEATHAEHNLIILGEQARQPLISAFVDEEDLLRIGQQIRQLDEAGIGVLHSLNSPWSPDHHLMLVYGDSLEGYTQAVEMLLTSTPPVFEPGSVALIRADRVPLVFQRAIPLIEDEVVVAERVVSETRTRASSDLPTAAPAPEPTQAASDLPVIAPGAPAPDTIETTVSDTERLILIITAFLIVLITLALVGRMLFKLAQ